MESVGVSHLGLITMNLMNSSHQGWLMCLKGESLLCSGLADSNKSLHALRVDALDVEWPCQGLTALHDRKKLSEYILCYELINLKLIIHLAF